MCHIACVPPPPKLKYKVTIADFEPEYYSSLAEALRACADAATCFGAGVVSLEELQGDEE